MRILVVSDIHAYSRPREDGSKPSYVKAGDTADTSPTSSFERLLQTGQIPKPDIVISPGDLSDQADQAGLNFAWTFLQRLVAHSAKGLLLATAGNHDVDSRYKATESDAKGMLLDLKPAYPVLAPSTTTLDLERVELTYWARNFYIVSCGPCRFVVLNSSAYHGAGSENSELEHGRISRFTLRMMRDTLQQEDAKRAAEGSLPYLNVLLCHHHLEKDGSIEDPDRSQMIGAHALVSHMATGENGRWLVVHGHRHRARLFQAGGITGPMVLSAASFGATRDRDYENTSPNQAHLIDLDFEAMRDHSLYPAGRIITWTWQPGMGWLSDRYMGGGLPPVTGFGFQGSVDLLARTIASEVAGKPPHSWTAICKRHPTAAFLPYDQLSYLMNVLRSQHRTTLVMGEGGLPLECGELP